MATSLYQKYRPQQFKDLIDQAHVVTTLQNAIAADQVAHAYLFTGPRGLGKTTVARLLAKAVNCTKRKQGEFEPCGSCDSCTSITNGNAIDVLEIDAASHTGVDNVRENIIANTRFQPSVAKYKVFIIDEVHMLSVAAFNALLKTLEEPPAHVLFVLATTENHKVPATIVSRCQRFDFHKVSADALVKRLDGIIKKEKKEVPKGVTQRITQLANGGVRDAESILGQILALSDKKITDEQIALVLPASTVTSAVSFIEMLVQRRAQEAIALINQLVDDGVDLRQFTTEVIELLRLALHMQVGATHKQLGLDITKETLQTLEAATAGVTQRAIGEMIDIFIAKRNELKSADIPQLPLEIAVVLITQPQDAPPPPPSAPPVKQVKQENPTPIKKENEKQKTVESSAPTPEPEVIVEVAVEQPVVAHAIDIDLKTVRSRWSQVLDVIKQHNHSLASTLRQHRPSAVHNDGSIEICFKYRFHEQRINESKNRVILDTVMTEVFGAPLRIQTKVVEKLPKGEEPEELVAAPEVVAEPTSEKKQAETGGIDGLVEAFGGTVLD